MKQTAIFPGRYVQSEGALADVGDEVSRLGTRALVIAGGTAHDSLLPSFLPHWSERLQLTVERFGGECSDQEIERLTQVAKQQACEVVVGMGGGKVIDTAKAVGYQAGAR
ncbi:MAG: iron-containing alcohol dehydrogenase, partial [Planctomycetota bacterium]|nr:iron-containing alcohol dehydrogenase [Planctomycetota bacterium]